MSNVILKLKYILRDIKADVIFLDNNLYRINSLFKKINNGCFDENTNDFIKVFLKENNSKEHGLKSYLDGLKDEFDNHEKYYELLKTYFNIKQESLIKLNSIEERDRNEADFTSVKEYIEKVEEQEKEDKELCRIRWIVERKSGEE